MSKTRKITKNNQWKFINPNSLLSCEMCYKLCKKVEMWKIQEKKLCKKCYLNYDFYMVDEKWKEI